jgi:hypothetical protein
MSQGGGPTLWQGRLRWRLRGALQWPLFVVLTVGDALLLGVLPISGRHTGFVPGLLVAMLFNLVAVAGVGRMLVPWLRRRRPDLPKLVAEDRVGSALLCLVTVALVVLGLANA